MTHRQVLEALSGLLLGMFVAILSSTVVSTALPQIIGDLGGTQSAYTWVVTAALLSMTVSTPIWGKLADLFSRKLLVQIALIIFVLGSALAGLSQNPGELIGFRALQGLGTGGLTALSQVILADIISPRDRGRYMGYLGAVMAVGTVGGPLLGGLITDSLDWRWCFYVGVPFAVIAIAVLQKTLHLPRIRRKVSIDYVGAVLLSGGVATLLIWVTLGGQQFEWWSTTTLYMVGGSVLMLILAIIAEAQSREPILPLWLFRNRTFVLSSLASIAVGIAMFGTSVFLSQYMQLARDKSPTETGLLTIPMAVGSFVSATVIGRVITRTGRWKRWMVLGGVLLTTGVALMSTIDYQTSFYELGAFMLILGLGVGMLMQNLVLAVQNTIPITEMGAASSGVAFFRSMGGAVGVSALGAVLASRVTTLVHDGLAELGIHAGALGGNGNSVPEIDKIPEPIRTVVERAYGDGIADIFLVAVPVAAVALLLVLFIKEIPLGQKSGIEQQLEMAGGRPVDEAVPAGVAAAVPSEPVLVGSAGSGSGNGNGNGGVAAVGGSGGGAGGGAAAAASEQAFRANGAHKLEPTFDVVDGLGGSEPEEAGVVLGEVRRADGTPVVDAALTLIDSGGRQAGRAASDPEGRYQLTAAGPGSYVLIASASATQPQAATVTVDGRPTRFDVVLAGVTSLTGLVRAHGVNQPVPGATAVLANERGDIVASAITGDDGVYRFDQLAAGVYTLAVRAERRQPVALRLTLPEAGSVRQDVALAGGARLRGQASTTEGRPVAEAQVSVYDAERNLIDVVTTDERGAYAFGQLAPGDYTVVVTGYPPVSTTVRLEAGQSIDHDVELGYPER
ncbi:MFS transporter [Flindersiella endophytica]